MNKERLDHILKDYALDLENDPQKPVSGRYLIADDVLPDGYTPPENWTIEFRSEGICVFDWIRHE